MKVDSDQIEGLTNIGSDVPASGIVVTDKKEQQNLFGKEDRRRQEEAKQAIHAAFIWLLRAAAVLFILVLVIRVFHFIVPDTASKAFIHGWLSDEQLQNIDKAFFSGALGALLTRHIKQVWPS